MGLDNSKEKDRLLRFVEYLTALARINSKTVWSLDDYQKTLWISDIPHESKYCFVRAWGEQDEPGDDAWIEVKKMQEPSVPKVPDVCKDWVKPETLKNIKELPELDQTITKEREERNAETGETFRVSETFHLQEFPQVQKEWETYIDNQWFPWTNRYELYTTIHNVYSNLFLIHQELSKLGEQYELVFCLGLLKWRTPSGHQVRRHLIVAKASLEFEPHIGRFTVRPTMEGDQTEVEFDMLNVEAQPQNARQLSEEGRKMLRENLWDRSAVDSLLNAIANSLANGGQGEYYADRMEQTSGAPTEKPIVEYAPALILRKRSLRGLELVLAKMKEQIGEGDEVPHEFLDLCECFNQSEESTIGDPISEAQASAEVGEIYFPLPTNEEQRRIILTLGRQRGVLVQGPPGTGKSHTIANLICHLLATGQRVLVTAKTPRALQVLHDKLPEEIKPLCISLLGNTIEERESLEKSVGGILLNIDRMNEVNIAHRIQQFENKIVSNREDKAEADVKITALREAETYRHIIVDGVYEGTAAQIARRLQKEAESFSWFEDRIAPDIHLPLITEELSYLCRGMVELDPESEKQLMLFIPDPENDMPAPTTVRNLFQREQMAKNKVTTEATRLQTEVGSFLRNAQSEVIERLAGSLSELATTADNVRRRPFPWISEAVNDVLSDKETQWKELLRLSSAAFDGLHDSALRVDSYQVSVPKNINRREILYNAKAVKNHFETGGKSGFLFFKPKVIREHGAFMTAVKVDGSNCSNPQSLDKLIDYFTVEHQIGYLYSLWGNKIEIRNGRFPLQIAQFEDVQEALEAVVQLCSLRQSAIEHINLVNGLCNPNWEDSTDLNGLAETCRAVLAQIELRNVGIQIDEIQNSFLGRPGHIDIHPIHHDFSQSFQKRDIESYCKFLELAGELRSRSKAVFKKKEAIDKIARSAPKLAIALTKCSEPKLWASRLKVLGNAWSWARAKSWLDGFLNTDGESLQRHSNRLNAEIQKNIGELAAVKAWDFCFSRMQEEHRRHLMGWQQSMRKLGKGTGKHAYTHRQNAQRHLNECRDSVPAWIMPLHRAYETVEAGPGVFDVIIVDEASQCGPEALPLMYLGKRILVVGDDKQISPEAVGVERGQVQRLMRDHLYDFSHADSFDVENSLFDHGRIRFSNRITLREHFRCMPEIINFSNDLCYRTDPLIPLRQYSPDRLEPLKVVHVTKGYREGDGQRVINKPEAQALADVVERCCRDKRYQGMTMGVIVLQGESQAYAIEELLLNRIGAEEMKERRIICGNPYSFQGDERDVIFLSMVAAPNERIGVMNKEADQRRFNVAASRAQDQMWLFHSATLNDLSKQCYRNRLLSYFLNPKSQIEQALGEDAEQLREKAFGANRMVEKPPEPFESWFEVDVALDIAGKGYRVVPQFEFAGKRIDLVVQGRKTQLAVECDGDFWHGVEEYIGDMERQRKLERSGWHFFRLRESHYYALPESALDPLLTILHNMGIAPITHEEDDIKQEDGNEANTDPDENSNEEEFYEEDGDEEEIDPDERTETRSVSIDEGAPDSIERALRMKADVLGKNIVKILRERPNSSCMREKMPTYILKRWNVRTRGIPRQRFAKKVDDVIAVMARKGYITIYKSKNVRIRLGWERYPDTDDTKNKDTLF